MNLDSVLKSRDITLLTKVYIVKAMVFPVVMYSCESWTIKKAEHQRIDAFELWCWRRRLKVPWTARRSNQSIWREINTEYSLERLILKLKLQYFGYLMQRDDSLEKSLRLGKIEGRRERGIREWNGWTALPMQWSWTWANSRRLWGTGRPGVLQSMGLQRVEHNWATEQEQKPECNYGSNWSGSSTTPGTLTGQARRGKERSFPCTSGRGMAMVTLWFCIPALQTCNRISFHCFKLHSLW